MDGELLPVPCWLRPAAMALRTALCFLFLWPSAADLALDLYKSAQRSGHLTGVPAEAEKIAETRPINVSSAPFLARTL